jgi:hypothetical protein
MLRIAHRILTLEQVAMLAPTTPIEFDVRDSGGRLLVTHDPFTTGIDLEEFLPAVKGRFLIVNVKSEGIEYRILDLLKANSIESFFFLDCSIPMMKSLSAAGETRLAIRYSELESLDTVFKWRGRAQWVWVDCFYSCWITGDDIRHLQSQGFKVCLVSPELQGRPHEIHPFAHRILETPPDAVCCKLDFFSKWWTAYASPQGNSAV